jgi:ABC-type dipeptide/oligopeptide/nickel transport system permease component
MRPLDLLGVVLRRLGWFVFTAWAVFTLSFLLMRLSPGGPFMGERKLPEEIRRNLHEFYNLNAPLHVQYVTTLGNVARLEFGPSQRLKDFTVNEIIRQGLPVSFSLGIISLTLALIVGTTAGVISAVKRNTIYDFAFMGLATLGIAVPNFVLASLAIIAFCFTIPVLPAAGWGSPQQIILPACCLAAPYAAYIARLTRAGMLEVLNLDYVRTAYAKGLSPRTVIVKHALRGAILPVVSYIGPASAGILTGSLVIERIFNVPGFGSHFIDAALQRDYTVAMGAVLVYTALLYGLNMIVDMSYSVIDPRVKLE